MTPEKLKLAKDIIVNTIEFKLQQIKFFADNERISIYSINKNGDFSPSFHNTELVTLFSQFGAMINTYLAYDKDNDAVYLSVF